MPGRARTNRPDPRRGLPAGRRILSWLDFSSAARYPSPNVLVIEPHGDTRELYHLWLTVRGFAVTIGSGAHDAVVQARVSAPDVVLLEPMGQEDGIGLIRALRNEPACADAVLIVLTTQASPTVRRRAIEAGADAYLVKPCGVLHVAEALARASRCRVRLVEPLPDGAAPSRVRLREAVRRCRAIRERLIGSAVGPAAADPR